MNRTAVNFDSKILKRQGKKGGKEIETSCLRLNHMGLRDVVQQLRA